MRVVEATEITDDLVAAVQRLLPLLSSTAEPPTKADIARVVASEATRLLVARDGARILGMLTLVMFRIPSGSRAWIEDVVVDDGARGKGVGEALNLAAIELARLGGARTIDLTSRPSREAANRLYRRLGFVPRETNLYRLTIT
jgi:ribosomal protein S18 acetylase RimI-like enzyme